MGVPEHAAKWQKILYFVNLITFGLGVAMIALAGYYLKSNYQQIVLPSWADKLLLAFGVIIVTISILGCWGAYTAPDKIDNQQCNAVLYIYFIILFISLVLQFAAAGVLLVLKGVISDAKKGEVTDKVNTLESNIETFLEDHPSTWIDVQNSLNCCGFNLTTGPLATGAACVNRSLPGANTSCLNDLLDKAQHQAIALSALAIVFGIMQIFAFIAAYMLLCCVKRD